MRQTLRHTIVVTAIGFVAGVLYRHFADPAAEATLANYTRSGLHGAGLALAGWSVHLYFTSPLSAWLTRWPLAAELVLRSVIVALVVATVTMGLQALLYGNRIEAAWLSADYPRIIGLTFALYILIAGTYELTRLIGSRVLFNVLIGRYRRPIREERVLLFLDLAGSTSLAEQMGELRVQDLLTRFFFDIDEAIRTHGGEVHGYVGDEVIVTWRVGRRKQQSRYLDCFFAIQDRIAARADHYRREFGVIPAFRAGMHAGPVAVSECGDSRRQVAYFGDTMNVAARLQGLCKDAGRSLLVSGDLLRLSVPGANVTVENLGPTQLRGRVAPIEVFAVERPVRMAG